MGSVCGPSPARQLASDACRGAPRAPRGGLGVCAQEEGDAGPRTELDTLKLSLSNNRLCSVLKTDRPCPSRSPTTRLRTFVIPETKALPPAQPALRQHPPHPTAPVMLREQQGRRGWWRRRMSPGWRKTGLLSSPSLSSGRNDRQLRSLCGENPRNDSCVAMLISSNHFSAEQPNKYDDQINVCFHANSSV